MSAWRRIFYYIFCAIGLGIAQAGLAKADPAATKAPALELVVLGSGGPGAVGRAASCHLILVDGTPRIFVDAGPGCFVRLGETGLPLTPIGIQLITHLHADHVGDLPGLVKARAVTTHAPLTFKIFGPDGHGRQGQIAYFPPISRFVDLLFGEQGAFAYLPDFAGRLTFDVTDRPAAMQPGQAPKVIYSQDGVVIKAIAGHHRDAPSIIYRVEHAGKSITFSGDIDPSGLDNLRKIAQDSAEAAKAQWRKVADQLRPKLSKLAGFMDEAEADVLAYMAFPKDHWPKIHSTNGLERLNGEVKRRTDVIGIFPNDEAIVRLVGAILLEQNDEWAVQRCRYMTLETIASLSDDAIVGLPAVAV